MPVKYFITGSTAIDQLMTFPGKFSDSLLADKLEKVSVSFLIEDMTVLYGGVGANISYGLGVLGHKPQLVSAVGIDFGEYRQWLEDHGVDTSLVHISQTANTARFVCTTDQVLAQIASFYPGAMDESKQIDLYELIQTHQPAGVIIAAGEPSAMVKHTAESHQAGVPVFADPSQQLPRLSPEQTLRLITDAEILFSNDYEWELIQKKTGKSAQELTSLVDIRITTLGENGVEVANGIESYQIPVVPEKAKIDPTGVGDAFRAGFLSAYSQNLPLAQCVQLGQLVAVYVLENNGPQGWEFPLEEAKVRCAAAYGEPAAEEIFAHLLR